jgi:hypothetical protein
VEKADKSVRRFLQHTVTRTGCSRNVEHSTNFTDGQPGFEFFFFKGAIDKWRPVAASLPEPASFAATLKSYFFFSRAAEPLATSQREKKCGRISKRRRLWMASCAFSPTQKCPRDSIEQKETSF